jgi:hypothetical protein
VTARAAFVHQHRLSVGLADADATQTSFHKYTLGGHIPGLDHGHDAVKLKRRERMLHDGKRCLARQTTPPRARVKVIAKLNLGPAML